MPNKTLTLRRKFCKYSKTCKCKTVCKKSNLKRKTKLKKPIKIKKGGYVYGGSKKEKLKLRKEGMFMEVITAVVIKQ